MKSILILLCASLAFASEEDVKKFAAGSKLFTGAIYNEILVDNNENILVSPFSVETVLALTQSGAVGVTGEELRASLYLPETKDETDLVIKGVLERINSDDKYTLHTANKVYVEQNFAIKEDFQNVATKDYHAAFENIEFADNVDAAADINQWVEEQTNNKIHDIVSPGDLDGETRVVLINALYFQANWSFPFQPLYTKKASFYAPNEKVVDIDAMFIESESFNFYESPELDAKFLELPFVGKGASMTFVLPNKKEGIAVLEKQVKTVLAAPKYKPEYVQVTLPKFKIESSIQFNGILEKLGVHAAFNPAIADFSGIAGEPGEIVISKISQKTFIDVNEGGVEAAAATSVVGTTSIPPPPTQIFTADHPFIFYISVDGVILFEGRVLVPEY